MSTSTNNSEDNEHPDRAIETPVYQNKTIARWHREHILSRIEADVLDIILRLDGNDQSGALCSI